MFNRNKKVDKIIKNLTLIHYYVKSRNKSAGYTDINKDCEEFFAGLFNIVLQSNLIRLEKIKKDHKGIDLGDEQNSIAMQITSSTKRKKIIDTITAFEDESLKLYKKYNKILYVFIIGEKKEYKTFDSVIKKKYRLQIIDIYDLISVIINSKEELIEEVVEYIGANIDGHFLNELAYNTGYLPKEEKEEIKKFKNAKTFIVDYFGESLNSTNAMDIVKDINILIKKLSCIDKSSRELLYSLIYNRNREESNEESIKVENKIGLAIKQYGREDLYSSLVING
ncbi:SMEK domain-containing protein [uncultured Metabacillus sp.]|uniref:SMEK domain-containing protein n=1 Tax=uncultured Metabacillus sp. TaxID=2860135 RepID=UPI00262946DB|nr:SMEK domain-containing protein [uncultured Metabacillus sp.]